MSLVLSAWVLSQPYFKDMLDIDFRKKLFEDKIAQLEEDFIPFGFVDDGKDEYIEIDTEGDRWHIEDSVENDFGFF